MIELIMVMVIIGVMASIVVVNYPASLRKARDVQRQNDLKTYQSALEVYAMKHNGLYPTSPYVPIPTLCPALGLTEDVCPNDPSSGTYYYQTNTNGTKYTVWSSMENTDENYVVCSDGLTGLAVVTPAAGICPTFSSVPTSVPLPTSTTGPVPTATNTPAPPASTPTNTPPVLPSVTPTSTPAPTNTPTATSIILNSASGVSCISKCSAIGRLCVNAGTDAGAENGRYWRVLTSGSCQEELLGGTCSRTMNISSPATVCGGNSANWINCRCQ